MWVDVFRNLPLLLLILFLFLWIPQSARNAWEDVVPGLVARGVAVRA